MTNGIELVLGIISLVIAVVLSIIVSYRWYCERNGSDKLAEMKKDVEELRRGESVSRSQLEQLRGELDRLNESLIKELKDIQVLVNDTGKELAVMNTKQEEVVGHIDSIKKEVTEIKQRLQTVEAIAKKARKYSHDHAILGSPI